MADPGGMGMLSVSHRMAVVSVQWFILWRIQGGGVLSGSHRVVVVSVQCFILWRIQGGGDVIREPKTSWDGLHCGVKNGCGDCPLIYDF